MEDISSRAGQSRRDGLVSDYAADIVATVREPLLVLDADLHIKLANRAFYQTFKLPQAGLGAPIDCLIYELGDGQWDIPALRKLLEELLPTKGHFDDYQVEHDFPGLGRRTMLLNARQLHDAPPGDKTKLILLAIEDITERRRAEYLSEVSEGRYRRLFEASHDGILILDAKNARITDVNPFLLDLLDFPREHFIGKELWEIGVFPDKEQSKSAMRELQEKKSIRFEDMPLKDRQGNAHPVEFVSNVYQEDHNPVIQCNIRDISERKAGADALRESGNRFRFLAESMPQKIFTAMADGGVDYFNREWTAYTGLSFEQIREWGWTQFIHPDDVEENVRRWKHSIDTGELFQFEHRFRRADGAYRWHLSRAHCMLDAEGESAMWIGSNTDIEDVKQGAQALRESEERYRKLFQSVPAAVFVCDREGVVQDYNRRAEEAWGRAPDRGDPAERYCGSFKLYLPDGTPLPHDQSPMVDVLREGTPRENVEAIIERPDRSRVPVLVNFFPLTDKGGEITGAITCFSDITQVKRFEREREALLANEQASRMEAEAANRAKDVFLATLSHEMRTPLNAIVGWMSILRGEGCAEEDLHEGLDVIDRNTKAQVQLIEDVLDVSRIISGKLRLEIRPCDLTDAVKAGIDVVRPAAAGRGVTLDVDLDPSACSATCDSTRIQQVVWNLVSNAVKFTPKGGTVRVTLTREKSLLQIQVSDTGQGISPELLPFVFDRFRQADSSTRRKFGGLGLGLSIVKHLVEMHGGTVEACSAGEGLGSTFTARLPIRAVRVDEDADERGGQRGHGGNSEPDAEDGAGGAPRFPLVRLDGLRVLVVDDEADARRILVKVLEGAGAIVTAAASAAEAIEAIPKARPDVLVSDLGMPDQDGYDLIRQLRGSGHHAKDLPAVALTAFVHKDDQRQALLAGFQVHVPKPVDPHDLTAVIASLAGRTGGTG